MAFVIPGVSVGGVGGVLLKRGGNEGGTAEGEQNGRRWFHLKT